MLNADKIKAAVTTLDACGRYGIEVNRAGFARCPFHGGGNEKTPSMKVYPRDRGYHCFGCGKSGDVITLVQELFGIPFQAACSKLNSDFNLGLGIDRPMTQAEKIAANKEAWEREKKKQERDKKHRELIDEWNAAIRNIKIFEDIISTMAPKDPNEEWDEYFCYALKARTLGRERADRALDALNDFEKTMYRG